MCIFHWFFQCISLHVFFQSCSFVALFLPILIRFQYPKRVKSEPKIVFITASHFVTFFWLSLDLFGVPFGPPKFAPKSPPRPWRRIWALLGCILAAQGSPHGNFGFPWAHLDPLGGAFVPHFGLPWAHFDPPWHPLSPWWARLEPFKAQFHTSRGLFKNGVGGMRRSL